MLCVSATSQFAADGQCRRSVSAVSVDGQCRRSVSTRPTRPSDRNRLFQPASYPVPRPEIGKNYENRDSLHTVYIQIPPFPAVSRPLFTVPAFIRRQIRKRRTSLVGATRWVTQNQRFSEAPADRDRQMPVQSGATDSPAIAAPAPAQAQPKEPGHRLLLGSVPS